MLAAQYNILRAQVPMERDRRVKDSLLSSIWADSK